MFRFDEKEFVAELDRKREQQFLKQVRDYDEQIASSMRLRGYKRIDSTERTVVFTFGEVTFSRNRWRKGKKNFIAKNNYKYNYKHIDKYNYIGIIEV